MGVTGRVLRALASAADVAAMQGGAAHWGVEVLVSLDVEGVVDTGGGQMCLLREEAGEVEVEEMTGRRRHGLLLGAVVVVVVVDGATVDADGGTSRARGARVGDMIEARMAHADFRTFILRSSRCHAALRIMRMK